MKDKTVPSFLTYLRERVKAISDKVNQFFVQENVFLFDYFNIDKKEFTEKKESFLTKNKKVSPWRNLEDLMDFHNKIDFLKITALMMI